MLEIRAPLSCRKACTAQESKKWFGPSSSDRNFERCQSSSHITTTNAPCSVREGSCVILNKEEWGSNR